MVFVDEEKARELDAKVMSEETKRLLLLADLAGYRAGLRKVGFPVEKLPSDPGELLVDGEIKVPDTVWDLLNNDSRLCGLQYRVIYAVARAHHAQWALRAIEVGEGPLGVLRGRENLAQPLELAGRLYVQRLVKDLHPVLGWLGLDRGVQQDKCGGVTYPAVLKMYEVERKMFFSHHGLQSYESMFRFVISSSDRLKGWPDELTQPFKGDWELVLDAINQIAVHY